MRKSKAIDSFKIRYKGRFEINHDISEYKSAKRLLNISLKHKNFGYKTLLNTHEINFHVGHVSGLTKVNKRYFHFTDIKSYYIFVNKSPLSMIIVCKETIDKLCMHYLKFEIDADILKFEKSVKNFINDKLEKNGNDDIEIESLPLNNNYHNGIYNNETEVVIHIEDIQGDISNDTEEDIQEVISHDNNDIEDDESIQVINESDDDNDDDDLEDDGNGNAYANINEDIHDQTDDNNCIKIDEVDIRMREGINEIRRRSDMNSQFLSKSIYIFSEYTDDEIIVHPGECEDDYDV